MGRRPNDKKNGSNWFKELIAAGLGRLDTKLTVVEFARDILGFNLMVPQSAVLKAFYGLELDPDEIAWLERMVAAEPLTANERAVAAIEIAEPPSTLGKKNFGMVAATTLIFYHDRIRWGSTNRRRFTGHEPDHVRPGRFISNYQVGVHDGREGEVEAEPGWQFRCGGGQHSMEQEPGSRKRGPVSSAYLALDRNLSFSTLFGQGVVIQAEVLRSDTILRLSPGRNRYNPCSKPKSRLVTDLLNSPSRLITSAKQGKSVEYQGVSNYAGVRGWGESLLKSASLSARIA